MSGVPAPPREWTGTPVAMRAPPRHATTCASRLDHRRHSPLCAARAVCARANQAHRLRQQPPPPLRHSPLVRGYKSAIPPREALILLAVIQHPWLLETHLEEFAELEMIHPDADRLRRAVLESASGEVPIEADKLQRDLVERGLESLISRVRGAITHNSDWPAREGAGEADVSSWWSHIVTLHRKARTLNRELKDAERALGDDPSEAHLAWIRDVQNRLAALEGTEALIEGFGASSGRLVKGG